MTARRVRKGRAERTRRKPGTRSRVDEIPEPQIEGLLRKLAWALRSERAEREGSIPFYRIEHRFIAAALEVVRRAAEADREGYRRLMGT